MTQTTETNSVPAIRAHRKGYYLETRVRIDRPIDEVFAFFADAGNLDRLTPPWLQFKIVTLMPVTMREGLILDYALKVHGLPLKWQSEITAWEPPHRFIDEQRKGPYKRWIHEHRFEQDGNQTLVIDQVDYAVPGGRLMHGLFVRRDLFSIFKYRTESLPRVFPSR